MSKTNISDISNVDAIIIFSPKPTGNILMKGDKINNVGPDKKTNKNRYGFFCLMIKKKLINPKIKGMIKKLAPFNLKAIAEQITSHKNSGATNKLPTSFDFWKL